MRTNMENVVIEPMTEQARAAGIDPERAKDRILMRLDLA